MSNILVIRLEDSSDIDQNKNEFEYDTYFSVYEFAFNKVAKSVGSPNLLSSISMSSHLLLASRIVLHLAATEQNHEKT